MSLATFTASTLKLILLCTIDVHAYDTVIDLMIGVFCDSWMGLTNTCILYRIAVTLTDCYAELLCSVWCHADYNIERVSVMNASNVLLSFSSILLILKFSLITHSVTILQSILPFLKLSSMCLRASCPHL